MQLLIKTDREAAATGPVRDVVTASGAIDIQSRHELTAAGRACLASGPADALVLDLAGITFIDSTGIGALVELACQSSDAGRDFVIANPSARVRRILEVTGLEQEWTAVTAEVTG